MPCEGTQSLPRRHEAVRTLGLTVLLLTARLLHLDAILQFTYKDDVSP